MKSYHQKFVSETPLEVYPTGEISGFPVSPGMFDLNGATPLQNGVNFTIHTCGGTAESRRGAGHETGTVGIYHQAEARGVGRDHRTYGQCKRQNVSQHRSLQPGD